MIAGEEVAGEDAISRSSEISIADRGGGSSHIFNGPVHREYWKKVTRDFRIVPDCMEEATYLRLHHHIVQSAISVLEEREVNISSAVVAFAAGIWLSKLVQSLAGNAELQEQMSRQGVDFWRVIVGSSLDEWTQDFIVHLREVHQQMDSS